MLPISVRPFVRINIHVDVALKVVLTSIAFADKFRAIKRSRHARTENMQVHVLANEVLKSAFLT